MAAKYTTAFADLQKFNKQDAIRQGKEKETKLADFKCQEDELRQQKLELQAKEAMLERLRDAQRKEEEALAVQKKAMRSKEIRLEAERRKLLGLGDCPGRVDGGSALKRRLSHKSEPEKKGDAKRRLHVKRETKAPCIQGIKLEKEGPKEEVDMERSSSEFDEESEPQCISRCEQCHESFDSNDSTHHFCFGHPGALVPRVECNEHLWRINGSGDESSLNDEDGDDEDDIASYRWDCCGARKCAAGCDWVTHPIRLGRKV